MRRSPAWRILSLLVSALFASHATEPSSLMLDCGMNGPGMGAMSHAGHAAGMPAMAHMAGGGATTHDASAPGAHDGVPSSPHAPPHTQCSCVGECTCAMFLALASARLSVPHVAHAPAHRPACRVAVEPLRTTAHIQPFPNGPPATA